MNKSMKVMLLGVGILFGGIFAYHTFTNFMMKRYFASNQSPIQTVSTMKVSYSDWQPHVKASGSLRAVKGVNVTTELAGMVKTILFTAGTDVKEGDVLVQLNADTDIAQLHALQASAELAKTIYNRDKAQYAIKAISKATLDSDAANAKNAQAQADSQAATVAKKTIRAPFTGQLGISAVNPGQFLNVGDKIVNLQAVDPMYVDFYVPQQTLNQLQIGQMVTIKIDSQPDKTYSGKITTIDPAIDTATRNIEVEALLSNPQHELTPGMFVAVTIDIGDNQRYLTLPQTAISFNPYGDVVYIVKQDGQDQIVSQIFVTSGDTRGDQVAILKGLQEGDLIVTSGQLKLKNGTRVKINNQIIPTNNPEPEVKNNH